MAEPDDGEQQNSSLRMIETSLENIHVAIGRFSTMGYLQSLLEAQAMCENFSKSRDNLIEALEKLATSRIECSTKDWVDDIQRVCDLLKGLRFEDCEHLKVAKDVHATSQKIINEDISEKSGFVLIRTRLLANRNNRPYNMQEEIQGLERELSRARVEKEKHEVEELNTIIRALKQSSPELEQDSRPQPPVEYLCPISQSIMKDPVVLVETGQTYDRKYIEEWFGRGNRTCPATKQTVTELNLTPNYALKSLASSWLDVNSAGDDGEDEDDSIIFQRNSCERLQCEEVKDTSKQLGQLDTEKAATICLNGGGYNTIIECGYSAAPQTNVSQALKSSTASSVDSTSLIPKKGTESCGASRESYSGKNQLYSPKKEDLPEHNTKPQQVIQHAQKRAMQTANVVNPLATPTTTSTSLNFGNIRADGGRHGAAAFPLPALANKMALAARANAKLAELSETRSTDHYEASTPRSTYSELQKRSCANMSLSDTLQALTAARRLRREFDGEEQTPRSRTSSSNVLFGADPKSKSYARIATNLARRKNGGPPSVCSGTSRASRAEREEELRQYDELDKVGSDSESGTDQQPTDEVEEDWHNCAEFETASLLSSIGSDARKYPASVVSMRRTTKKSINMCTGAMLGATNVLFGDNDDEDEDRSSSIEDDEDSNDVSLPVLANLLKTNDPELAASLASDLAIKAQTDPALLQDIPRMDIIPSLIKLLSLPSDAVKSAAARALGVIGERCSEANVMILNHGAIPILSRLNKEAEKRNSDIEEGSMEDVAGATRYALGALASHTRDGASIDVSPQMLVELLTSPDEDLQASAVLDLLEKLNSGYAEMVLKELTEQSVALNLVDVLEHREEDAQFAAAEILSKMIFHDQKTQRELSQSIGIVSKLLRLIKQADSSTISCKCAAAQVIRGLAHNNSKIREDVLKRGVIPEFAMLLMCNDPLTRETAAWMLGIMASHSQTGQDEVAGCERAMFMLDELAENGAAQEKVAAKFALRAVNIDVGYDDDDELSVPLVIQSLKDGVKEVKIAAAWELCRMANSNQWSQIEIYECGGVSALLAYLKARPGPDGTQACLSTLVKLTGNEARVAAQISQEDGVLLAVQLLKSPAVPDKKLVIQLLTILAEKCPVHQQQLVSSGSIPVLVDLLYSEESICNAASQALGCLIENDMSVISASVTELAAPTLLDLAASTDCPTFSKKAAIQLLGKMGEATYDCQQVVVQQGALDILYKTIQAGEEPEIMIAATKAAKSLSKKDFRDTGAPMAIPKLVGMIKNIAPQQKPMTPGLVRIGEYVPSSPMSASSAYSSMERSNSGELYVRTPHHVSGHVPAARTLSKKPSIANSMALPVVQELREESESESESDMTQSTSIHGNHSLPCVQPRRWMHVSPDAPDSPLSRTTYDPTLKKPAFDVIINDLCSDYQESVHAESESRSQIGKGIITEACTPKPTPFAPAPPCSTPRQNRIPDLSPPVKKASPRRVETRVGREATQLVEKICVGVEHYTPEPRKASAAVGQIRKLASTNRQLGSELLRSGALGMLVDRLKTHSASQ